MTNEGDMALWISGRLVVLSWNARLAGSPGVTLITNGEPGDSSVVML